MTISLPGDRLTVISNAVRNAYVRHSESNNSNSNGAHHEKRGGFGDNHHGIGARILPRYTRNVLGNDDWRATRRNPHRRATRSHARNEIGATTMDPTSDSQPLTIPESGATIRAIGEPFGGAIRKAMGKYEGTPDLETLAHAAHSGYWLGPNSESKRSWETLPPEVKDRWRAAASNVMVQVIEHLTNMSWGGV